MLFFSLEYDTKWNCAVYSASPLELESYNTLILFPFLFLGRCLVSTWLIVWESCTYNIGSLPFVCADVTVFSWSDSLLWNYKDFSCFLLFFLFVFSFFLFHLDFFFNRSSSSNGSNRRDGMRGCWEDRIGKRRRLYHLSKLFLQFLYSHWIVCNLW